MSRPARFRQADITRAVKAVEKAGVPVGAVDILPDGAMRLHAREAGEQRDSFEAFFARREAGRQA